MYFRRIILIIVALLVAASLVLPATAPAERPQNWSNHVALAPNGAHQIGKPTATTRLVEYVSYTCSHCAHFVTEASAPLKSDWVSKGDFVIEVRNLVRDRYDLTAALLARCGGPARFPGNHEALFANYDVWIEKVRQHSQTASPLPADADRTAVMADIAEKTGLFAFMAKRGVTPAQSRACLADAKAMDMVLAMTQYGIEQDKITGTPSFLINGKHVAAYDWTSLRPLLPAPAN